VLVAEMVQGIETVVGVAQDDLFGPVVMFGLGGVFIEVLKDVTFRVPPFTKTTPPPCSTSWPARPCSRRAGQPAADRAALVDALMKMQHLAVDLARRGGRTRHQPPAGRTQGRRRRRRAGRPGLSIRLRGELTPMS
jgi:hypothetical protein